MSRLFEPLKLRELTLANRVVVPPMCQYMAEGGLPSAWHEMHLGSLGISGAGLVIVEGTGVEDVGRISPADLGLYTDEQEEALRRLLVRLRSYAPAKWGIQLAHAGRKASSRPFDEPYPASPDEGGWTPIGPSAVAHSDRWPTPVAMSQETIERVVASFAAATRRADRAGFDLVEVHAAHGYLISSFLSPVANKREDGYGGPLPNRMRFALEVARAMRAAWPADKPIGFRINGTDWTEEGINPEEATELARQLRESGIDYVTVSSGGNSRDQKLPPVVPGYQVHVARTIREGAGIPTMTVGMILKADQAEKIVETGEADLVGVARATLDDPRWALHAAQELGGEVEYPRPWWRLSGKHWPGYRLVRQSANAAE